MWRILHVLQRVVGYVVRPIVVQACWCFGSPCATWRKADTLVLFVEIRNLGVAQQNRLLCMLCVSQGRRNAVTGDRQPVSRVIVI